LWNSGGFTTPIVAAMLAWRVVQGGIADREGVVAHLK
jgi:hypothetical protein